MADQARDAAAQAGQAAREAAQPAMEFIWGQVQLRITDVWTVRGLAIGAFYLANRTLTMVGLRRAIERRDPDNPDQPANPQVGEGVREDSLLVPVIFYSKLGYQYFTSILNGPFLKACIQKELEEIGYENPIDVSVERWELPNLPEGGAGLMGMMGEERVLDWIAELPEKMSQLSTAVDSGLPDDISSEAAGTAITSLEDVEEEEEEEAGPSLHKQQKGPLKKLRARLWKQPREVESTSQGEKKKGLLRRLSARLKKQPPVRAQSTVQQAELQEGPLKRQRAGLLQHKDSPTAQTQLKACIHLERGAEMVTTGGNQKGEGVEHLLEGIILMEAASPDIATKILYDQPWLNLDKTNLDTLITKQLKATPDSTTCLLMQALQLPIGHSRQQAINHVIDIVLQHGETDPMYKHLAYIYCTLAYTIMVTTRQPAPALSAFASALMHKSDHLQTLFFTAYMCSAGVSVPQAIRQFHHYIHTAPTDHRWVPYTHYYLVTLYGQQDPSVHRDRILHHYNMAQQTDRDRLPMFESVPSGITDRAKNVYDQVKALPGM